MSLDTLDFQDALRDLMSANLELTDAETEFRRVADGVARAVGMLHGLPDAVAAGPFDAVAETLNGELRTIADRHQRAADLVAPEDIAEMRQKLTEEAARWMGEGGDDFEAYLERVGYQPQPIVEIKRGGGPASKDFDEFDDENNNQGQEDFSPLDLVHDAVLNVRDEELRLFFSSADDEDDDAGGEGATEVVGNCHFSLQSLRHMAEQREGGLPVFATSSDRARIASLAVDVVPIAEDGTYPPFDECPDKNPFVQNSDELLGRMARFAVRVQSIRFEGEEQQRGLEERMAAFARKRRDIQGRPGKTDLAPVDMFVRYRLPPQLRPALVETHTTLGQDGTGAFAINHSQEWDKLVDEEFLDELSAANLTFELVFVSRKTIENQLKTPRDLEDTAERAAKASSGAAGAGAGADGAAKAPTPQTLRELIAVRMEKHVDLRRQLEAEILRAQEEELRRAEERDKFAAEFRAAFEEDVKHLRRAIDRMRLQVKDGVHHKKRGTAKQMTAERLAAERERRNELKRKNDEKTYNVKCAANHLRAMEMQNLASEIHNLKRRKEAVERNCAAAEVAAQELAEKSTKVLDDAIKMKQQLSAELNTIAHLRGDINIRHAQARKSMSLPSSSNKSITSGSTANGGSVRSITSSKK